MQVYTDYLIREKNNECCHKRTPGKRNMRKPRHACGITSWAAAQALRPSSKLLTCVIYIHLRRLCPSMPKCWQALSVLRRTRPIARKGGTNSSRERETGRHGNRSTLLSPLERTRDRQKQYLLVPTTTKHRLAFQTNKSKRAERPNTETNQAGKLFFATKSTENPPSQADNSLSTGGSSGADP